MTENGDSNLKQPSFFFALGKCGVANKSLKHLSSIELGLLKFAVAELLFWCENFIDS